MANPKSRSLTFQHLLKVAGPSPFNVRPISAQSLRVPALRPGCLKGCRAGTGLWARGALQAGSRSEAGAPHAGSCRVRRMGRLGFQPRGGPAELRPTGLLSRGATSQFSPRISKGGVTSKLSLSCGGGNAGWTRSLALRPPTECSVPYLCQPSSPLNPVTGTPGVGAPASAAIRAKLGAGGGGGRNVNWRER